MRQPGIEVVPLLQMTGQALFNEVFLTDARVGDGTLIGGLNNGWRVANTTLMFERTSLGAGGSSAAASWPGQVAGDLGRRAVTSSPAAAAAAAEQHPVQCRPRG